MSDFSILKEIYKSSGFGDVNDIRTEWRNLKLKLMLNDDIKFEPNIDLIKKKSYFRDKSYWQILKKYRGNTIITGSLSLKAFGLMEREVSDIDLIALDSSIVKTVGKHHDRYDTDVKELIGYDKVYTKYFGIWNHERWYVDFFEHTNQTFVEKDGYLFQSPIEVMDKKIDMVANRIYNGHASDRTKDLEDFLVFANILNSMLNEKESI